MNDLVSEYQQYQDATAGGGRVRRGGGRVRRLSLPGRRGLRSVCLSTAHRRFAVCSAYDLFCMQQGNSLKLARGSLMPSVACAHTNTHAQVARSILLDGDTAIDPNDGRV